MLKKPTFHCCVIGLASYIKGIIIRPVYTRVGLVLDQDNYSEEFHSMSVQTHSRWCAESILYSAGAWTLRISLFHTLHNHKPAGHVGIPTTQYSFCLPTSPPMLFPVARVQHATPEHVPPEGSDPISCGRLVHKAVLRWGFFSRPAQKTLNTGGLASFSEAKTTTA